MTKLFAWLFAATLVLGLSAAPTLTYAEDPVEESEEATTDDESMDEGSDTTEAPQEDPMEEAEEGQ